LAGEGTGEQGNRGSGGQGVRQANVNDATRQQLFSASKKHENVNVFSFS